MPDGLLVVVVLVVVGVLVVVVVVVGVVVVDEVDVGLLDDVVVDELWEQSRVASALTVAAP